MWRSSCAVLTKHKTGLTNMRQFGINIQKIQHWLCCIVVIVVILLPYSRSDALLKTSKRSPPPTTTTTTTTTKTTKTTTTSSHSYKGSKYTIDDLINRKFSYKISNDIDMDPCKASTYSTLFRLKSVLNI